MTHFVGLEQGPVPENCHDLHDNRSTDVLSVYFQPFNRRTVMSKKIDDFFNDEEATNGNAAENMPGKEAKGKSKPSAPPPGSGYIGQPPKEDARIQDPLSSLLSEMKFGHGSYRDNITPAMSEFMDKVGEALKKEPISSDITNKLVAIDADTFPTPIAGIVTTVKGDDKKYLFVFVLRADEASTVPVNQLIAAIEAKHLWAEDVLTMPDIIDYVVNTAAARINAPIEDLVFSGSLIVPIRSASRAAEEIAHIGAIGNYNASNVYRYQN